jgi:hypothetical protein
MTGPRIAPIAQTAIMPARFSLGTMSATVPEPMVNGHTPATPANSRKTISCGRLCATAQAMVKMRKRMLQVWYRGTRPYISDRGAITKGPTMYPRMKTETTKEPSMSLVEWNSRIASPTPGANIDEARGLHHLSCASDGFD